MEYEDSVLQSLFSMFDEQSAGSESIGSRFDQTEFDALFQALDQAEQPPSRIYTDASWFERERTTIFHNAWHFFCLSTDVEQPGEYRTRRFLQSSLILVRGDDYKLRAFFNTCRHRGAPLTPREHGHVRNFICPFHRWAYRRDGRLFKAPGLGVEERALGCIGSNLIELPCEVRENLVFVHLQPQPKYGLDEFLGDFISSVAHPHGVSNMRSVTHRRYRLNANWKLYAEVDMETLHTPHVHRRSIGEQPVEITSSYGHWVGVFNRSDQTVALPPDQRDSGFPFNAAAHGAGLEGTHFSIVFPGFFIVMAPDCMWWIQKTPISATEVEVDVSYCFPTETIERSDFRDTLPRYVKRLDQVIEEDDDIVEYQQKGLNAYVSGRYTRQEAVVHALVRRYVEIALRGDYSQPIRTHAS
ncbi:aromatic ring-hydroxylating oxygenase subunit alpha [Salinisphaera hydrothermalis]|uniref:aromatic ring-hydroxylating oxygenase subunit alpha n=1 Tax=Salinisphaera hydrothermalis TaxID=563188 RepID=UPI00333EB891